MSDTQAGLRAAKAALRLRRTLSIESTSPVSIFDVARNLDIDVWFVDVPSLEGMYVAGSAPSILIGGHRPAGRQVMTCAHEIGHHIFGHGTQVDEYLGPPRQRGLTPEEYLANSFAANLLMTRSAVVQGFLSRGVAPTSATSEHVYAVATWLGVGYSALLYHMSLTLGLISRHEMERLLRTAPKTIRQSISTRLGLASPPEGLLIADAAWVGRPLDVQVGDVIMVPKNSHFDHTCGSLREEHLELTAPGIGRLSHADSGWCAYVRVARRHFLGHADYRHLEDSGDDAI